MLLKIIRLIHTLRYLQTEQLFLFIMRRFLPSPTICFENSVELRSDFCSASPLPVMAIWQDADVFHFLNHSKILSQSDFDWRPDDVSRLWRYNLHYFDYLREADRSDQEKAGLLINWVANNPQGRQPGWEPFTASLRIVNWVFFISRYPQAGTADVLHSLYVQALWLEKNDERHILANHYFENLKAFFFAGLFFSGKDADRWLSKSIVGMQKQLIEQTLADGGHYERTPQYHGLMLENVLDIFNLASSNPGYFSTDFITRLERHCEQGLAFFQTIQFPDQKLPLFNDTAFGISSPLSELNGYFQRLTSEPSCLPEQTDQLISLDASGLYGFRSNQSMFVIDAGDIGPSYQPGHTHCDMLSYELMLESQRVIVDTGVCEYEPGQVRQHIRSTRAHNTISVDGADQSEVWGEFRVARRAKILSAQIQRQSNIVVFEGSYEGFHRVGRRVQHHRSVTVDLASDDSIQSLTINDTISVLGNHAIESFIHIHPEFEVTDQGGGIIALKERNGLKVQLDLENDLDYYLEESIYCPEFGLQIPNTRVVLQKQSTGPTELSYSIRKV